MTWNQCCTLNADIAVGSDRSSPQGGEARHAPDSQRPGAPAALPVRGLLLLGCQQELARSVDLAYGACLYAVTESGEFLLAAEEEQTTDGQGGWRTRMLGIRGVTGLAALG